MKSLFAVPLCAAALLLTGCEEKSPTGNAVNNAAKQAGAAATGAATALKDTALATAQSAFDGSKKTLDDLIAKAGKVPESAKPAVDAALATAKEKFAAAEKLFNEFKASPSDGWQKLSDEFTKAIGAANDAIKAALDKIPK
jgi:hypothetical protein